MRGSIFHRHYGYRPGAQGGGEVPIVYLLRDEFLTDEAAPLTSPRTCEPGPGTLTLVQDDGQFSISDEALNIPAQASPAFTDLGYYSGPIERVTGRVLLGRFTFSSVGDGKFMQFGYVKSGAVNWYNSGNNANVFTKSYSTFDASENGQTPVPLFTPTATTYDFALVLRVAGAFYFVKGGVFSEWALVWAAYANNTATLYAALTAYNATGTQHHLKVYDLPAPFTADEGIAAVDESTPASDTPFTATPDGIHTFVFSLPPSPSDGDKVELRYRSAAVDTYMTAYCVWIDATSKWGFKLDSVDGGSVTNKINIADAGTPNTIRIIVDGTKHQCYTAAGGVWTKRGNDITHDFQGDATTIKPVYAAGTTSISLKSYPRHYGTGDVPASP